MYSQRGTCFTSTAARKKLIASLMKDAQTYGFDGINLDVEGNQGFCGTLIMYGLSGELLLWIAEDRAWSLSIDSLCAGFPIPRFITGESGDAWRIMWS